MSETTITTDYDPETLSVAADDGGRISVFDLDECPMPGCDGHLIQARGFGPDQALCQRCGFHAIDEITRADATAGEGER